MTTETDWDVVRRYTDYEDDRVGRDALTRLQARMEKLEDALHKADSSLTWCEARHRNEGHNADVLHDAIIAAQRFTRPRAALTEGGKP